MGFEFKQPLVGEKRCMTTQIMAAGETTMRYIYGLLTKREVKMAGYWPSSFFACHRPRTSTSSRSINTQKKNEANIQPF